MKIVIIGAGKVGSTLAEQLANEAHQLQILDIDSDAVEFLDTNLDVLTSVGDGLDIHVLRDAGVKSADLVIATMPTDEQNLTACLLAKKLGAENTVARVREPQHLATANILRSDLGLSMILNPESSSASEIARILRTPSAIKIDTFCKGKVELYKVRLSGDSPLNGLSLQALGRQHKGVLICSVERNGDQVYIPDGHFVLQAGDYINFVADPTAAYRFLKKINIPVHPVRQVMLIGGSLIAYYLAKELWKFKTNVKIIESNKAVCDKLSVMLPYASIIHGDGTDENLLREECIDEMDAVVTLTGYDEANILISLHARTVSQAKIVTKINRTGFSRVISSMELGSVFHPRDIAANLTVRFARALHNSMGSNVETLYKLMGGRVEALEFRATEKFHGCGIKLMDLKTRPNLLIGAINRAGAIITPGGQDSILPGDTVVVVTTTMGLKDLDDILE
jgi:trk system potassium uptake protein TrkA